MILTLVTLGLAAVGFVWGKLRADIVALIALLILAVGGVITTQEALSGFSNPIVVMMAGLFIVGGAIFNTGLAKMLGAKLLKLGGNSPTRLFLVVVISTGLIGGFVSNTGTVALMMPIVVSMAAASGASPSRFLMPIAFASSMGGMLTLIGTPPNLVIAEVWEEAGGAPLTMFSFFPAGIVCLVVGTILLIPLSRLLTRGKRSSSDNGRESRSLTDIVDEYNLNHDLYRIQVKADSPIAGLTLGNLALRANYGLDVLELRMGDARSNRRHLVRNVTQEAPTAASVIDPGDSIFVRGHREGVERFVKDYNLQFADERHAMHNELRFYDIGLAEVIPMANSDVLRQTIAQLDFRNRFNVNVLAVRRGRTIITEGLGDIKVRKGDVLLVQGTWSAIAGLSKDRSDIVVLGEPESRAAQVTIDYKAPLAAVIMIAMIAGLVLDFVPAVFTVLIAATVMIISGCFHSVADAYRTINWESIFLIAAMMPMSFALEKTGVSEMVAGSLVEYLGNLGPHALLAGIYLTTSIMTLFISNTATAVLLAPIAVQSATAYGVSPLPMLFAVTFGASLCFASPFSTPPNALVMPAAGYTFTDYLRVGAPLQILLGLLMIFAIPLIFPF